MKNKFIYVIIIGIIALFTLKYVNKVVGYYFSNGVLDYGEELTIYQILGDNVDLGEYSYLENYVYKTAKVKSIGNTHNIKIKIGYNEIVLIGNRDLIEINDVLYVQYKK